VGRVVFPSAALLDAEIAPLKLCQSAVLRQVSGMVLGQNNMPVLKLSVLVLLRILDLLCQKRKLKQALVSSRT
jgi:hypothetical protein